MVEAHTIAFFFVVVVCLFAFSSEKLYCVHLAQDLGNGSGVVKKLPTGCSERLR